MDHLTFNKGVLKTSCKCKSALIRSPKIEKQKNSQLQWRGRGGGEGGKEGDRLRGREVEREVEIKM